MLPSLLSLGFLLLFAEFASANFKRLAPVLEAWDQSKEGPAGIAAELTPLRWLGGWEKLAVMVWALGVSIPLLAFALACHLFLQNPALAGNLILGSTVGANVISLSLGFGLVLLSGPITFFRVRSITSPVFLLLATVVFLYTCLDNRITVVEGFLLLLLIAAYGLYFRNLSSEWKYYERAFARQSLVESSEGFLPILALLCMGVGFFVLAVLVSYPLVTELGAMAGADGGGAFRIGAHLVAIALYAPWIARCLWASREGTTARAITLSSISHACLLNVLLLPALAAFLGAKDLAPSLFSLYLPALFIFTGIFVSTLLIEKEKGGRLPWILILFYLAYTGLGLIY
jgi:cation:H+ antiporter